MRKIGSQTRETLAESGLELYRTFPEHGFSILHDPENGHYEVWAANDHHSGYTIEINGIGHEFARQCLEPELHYYR